MKMKIDIEALLPAKILGRASVAGNEYAWTIEDIPLVIDAVRQANLVNIGGQLQFRLPEGVCECYWVEVDTYRTVPRNLEWPLRVVRTAGAASEQFSKLCEEFDFVAEGLKAFPGPLGRWIEAGGDPKQPTCFVWYMEKQGK